MATLQAPEGREFKGGNTLDTTNEQDVYDACIGLGADKGYAATIDALTNDQRVQLLKDNGWSEV